MAALLAKASFMGTMAQVAAPVAALVAKPVIQGVLTAGITPTFTNMGSSSASHGTAMNVDEPETNHYNPNGLDENCAFVSMAYLLDPTGKKITAHDMVNITEEMQPADGTGGVELETVQRMLDQVKAKQKREYKIKQWDTRVSPMAWCRQFNTDRFAIGFRRHSPTIPCKTLSREEGGTKEDTHCTVVENAHLYPKPDISGHFVVYDANPLEGKSGFRDFQADGKPPSTERDGQQWITEHGVVTFAILPAAKVSPPTAKATPPAPKATVPDPNAMDVS